MNEMVERVAKALMDQCDGFTVFYEGEYTARALARAAITAMREPTPEMFYAGDLGVTHPTVIWKAMIDAALENSTVQDGDNPRTELP